MKRKEIIWDEKILLNLKQEGSYDGRAVSRSG
jgi:hypothetical protein